MTQLEPGVSEESAEAALNAAAALKKHSAATIPTANLKDPEIHRRVFHERGEVTLVASPRVERFKPASL